MSFLVVAAMVTLSSICSAQTIGWGVKGGFNRTSVPEVADYYDWVLCCLPNAAGAAVDPTAGTGATAGGFVTLSIHRWLSVQGELLFSRRRHAVDLRPYEPIDAIFTRDYIELSGLLKLEGPTSRANRIYIAGGPLLGFRTAERAKGSDPRLVRGDPETDIYVVQILPYATRELLRTSQVSLAVAGGWVYRRFLVEVRLTQGLQSIFKDRDGLVSGLVAVGGHEATLRRTIADFGPFLEAAKSRDVAMLAGFRF